MILKSIMQDTKNIWNNTTTRAIDDEPEDNIMVDEQVHSYTQWDEAKSHGSSEDIGRIESYVATEVNITVRDRQSPKTLKEMIAARTKTRNPLSISPNPDETWEVEEVIEKASTTLTEYLVKWKGREGQEWVTARHFSNPEYARQELERLGAEAFDEGEGVGIEESRMTGKSRKHDEAMRRAREQMVRDMVDLTKDSEELVRNREELAKDRKKLIKDKEAFVERVERFEERLEDEMDGVRYGRVSESESPPVKRRRGRPRKKGDGESSYLE
ncbi:hypothetical protein M7I_5817 [Glarea lozoyensis 74030]|uniref:Chromo domain-containing protein n=1 Tax=Glarea lozoyensis (strain ATCC 74030 / MF5533) TaxID=1104152 RepID=H0ESZ9_GLAL7|nr:hypothetical protein M7I_5817 [Glarea lozoyensis 74030]